MSFQVEMLEFVHGILYIFEMLNKNIGRTTETQVIVQYVPYRGVVIMKLLNFSQ